MRCHGGRRSRGQRSLRSRAPRPNSSSSRGVQRSGRCRDWSSHRRRFIFEPVRKLNPLSRSPLDRPSGLKKADHCDRCCAVCFGIECVHQARLAAILGDASIARCVVLAGLNPAGDRHFFRGPPGNQSRVAAAAKACEGIQVQAARRRPVARRREVLIRRAGSWILAIPCQSSDQP